MRSFYVKGNISFASRFDALSFCNVCERTEKLNVLNPAKGKSVVLFGVFVGTENDFDSFVLSIPEAVFGEIEIENTDNGKALRYALLDEWRKQCGRKTIIYENQRNKIK